MPTRDEIQVAILEEMYDNMEIPMISYFYPDGIAEQVVDRFSSIDLKKVKVEFNDMEDRGLLKTDRSSIQMTPQALEQLDQEYDTGLDPNLQEMILKDLKDQETKDPDHPSLFLDDMSDKYDFPESIIAENLFVMDRGGLIDIDSVNQTYAAEISYRGRDQL